MEDSSWTTDTLRMYRELREAGLEYMQRVEVGYTT